MLDGGPVGWVERTQQTLRWRREEEEVSKFESEDNLLHRIEIHSLSKRSREDIIVQTETELSDS